MSQKTIVELRAERSMIGIESRKLADKGNKMTPADQKRIEDLYQDSMALQDQITALETRAARPPRGQVGASNDEQVEVAKRSMRDFIVHGKVTEQRDLGVGAVAGSITGGSQLVAPAFSPILTQAQLAYGGVVNIVNQRQTETGASMKVSLVNDTANGLTTWGEDTAATETDPALSTVTSNTDKYTTGVILVTLEELEDSYFDLDAFIRDAFGQRLYRGLAKNISQGSGNFASYFSGATSGATSAGPTAVTYADLLALYGSLDPAYLPNATWTMNAATRTALLGVVDTTGRPLFQPALSAPNGADALGTLMGHPVVLDQFAPNLAATNKAIAFGDFKAGYTLRNVGQFNMPVTRTPTWYLRVRLPSLVMVAVVRM
jgi:HK97 family phage major capsid protein